jgi:hypothetical protein
MGGSSSSSNDVDTTDRKDRAGVAAMRKGIIRCRGSPPYSRHHCCDTHTHLHLC